MARCSNAIVCAANFFALLIAVPVLCSGYWLQLQSIATVATVIALGAALLVLSILGMFGSCCRLNFFLIFYLFLALMLIIIYVIVFMIGSSIITSKTGEDAIKEYKFESSSKFFSCIIDAEMGWYREVFEKATNLCGPLETTQRLEILRRPSFIKNYQL